MRSARSRQQTGKNSNKPPEKPPRSRLINFNLMHIYAARRITNELPAWCNWNGCFFMIWWAWKTGTWKGKQNSCQMSAIWQLRQNTATKTRQNRARICFNAIFRLRQIQQNATPFTGLMVNTCVSRMSTFLALPQLCLLAAFACPETCLKRSRKASEPESNKTQAIK